MSQIRKAQILGVGILTPALTGPPHAAAARSVDIAAQNMVESVGVASHNLAIELLEGSVFALSQAEKLKIGGGRIRLSEVVTKGKKKKPKAKRAKMKGEDYKGGGEGYGRWRYMGTEGNCSLIRGQCGYR
jgi:hypothetical protein